MLFANDVTELWADWVEEIRAASVDSSTCELSIYVHRACQKLHEVIIHNDKNGEQLFDALCVYLEEGFDELCGSKFFYTANPADALLTDYCFQIATLLYNCQSIIYPNKPRRPLYHYLMHTLQLPLPEAIEATPLDSLILSDNRKHLIPISIFGNLTIHSTYGLTYVDGSSNVHAVTESERKRLFAHSSETKELAILYRQAYEVRLTEKGLGGAIANLIHALRTGLSHNAFFDFWYSLTEELREQYGTYKIDAHGSINLFDLIHTLGGLRPPTRAQKAQWVVLTNKRYVEPLTQVPIAHPSGSALTQEAILVDEYAIRLKVAHFLSMSSYAGLFNQLLIRALLTLTNAFNVPIELPTFATTQRILQIYFRNQPTRLAKVQAQLQAACQRAPAVLHGIFYLLATKATEIPNYLAVIELIIQNQHMLIEPIVELAMHLAHQFEGFLENYPEFTPLAAPLAASFKQHCEVFRSIETIPSGSEDLNAVPFKTYLLFFHQLKSVDELKRLLFDSDADSWRLLENSEKTALKNKIDSLIPDVDTAIDVLSTLIAQNKVRRLPTLFIKTVTRLLNTGSHKFKAFLFTHKIIFHSIALVHCRQFVEYFLKGNCDHLLFFVIFLTPNQFAIKLKELELSKSSVFSAIPFAKINFFCQQLQSSLKHFEIFCEALKWETFIMRPEEWSVLFNGLTAIQIGIMVRAIQMHRNQNTKQEDSENIGLITAIESKDVLYIVCEELVVWFKRMLHTSCVDRLLDLLNNRFNAVQRTAICDVIKDRLCRKEFTMAFTLWAELDGRVCLVKTPAAELLLVASFKRLFLMNADCDSAIQQLASYMNEHIEDTQWLKTFCLRYTAGLLSLLTPVQTEKGKSYKNLITFLSAIMPELGAPLCAVFKKFILPELLKDVGDFVALINSASTSEEKMICFNVLTGYLPKIVHTPNDYVMVEKLIETLPVEQQLIFHERLQIPSSQAVQREDKFFSFFRSRDMRSTVGGQNRVSPMFGPHSRSPDLQCVSG